MKIVFATGNAHKLQEINEIINKYPRAEGGSKSLISGRGQIEFILPPEGFDPVENGETFEENSLIKAREAARISGNVALADDSGLCVDALNGEPGIHSARYAETAQARIDKLLNNMKNENNRRAKFVCAMTLVDKDGEILFQTRGECHGEIAYEQFGTNGFGYDPIFVINNAGKKTMAEFSEEEKNNISHRGVALRKVLDYLSSN